MFCTLATLFVKYSIERLQPDDSFASDWSRWTARSLERVPARFLLTGIHGTDRGQTAVSAKFKEEGAMRERSWQPPRSEGTIDPGHSCLSQTNTQERVPPCEKYSN